MKNWLLVSIVLLLALSGCAKKNEESVIVAASQPVALILREITGNVAAVKCLIPPGASPHTFSPGPSVSREAQNAKILFYVSPLLDGWASDIPDVKKIQIISLIPKNELMFFGGGNQQNEVIDPHFWTDPVIVKSIAMNLADSLSAIDPANSEIYKNNAGVFIKRLDSLDNVISNIIKAVKGKYVFTYHPSFRYFVRRYGLNYGGSIEDSPGKEPTPGFISELISKINSTKTRAIFSEPQLPENIAQSVAEAAHIKLLKLDPNGGVKGRENYFDLMTYNARILVEALGK